MTTINLMPRKVIVTEIGENKEITISTIFMPDGYHANMYETMIFDEAGKYDSYQVRYETEEQSLLGHIDAIAYVIRSGL